LQHRQQKQQTQHAMQDLVGARVRRRRFYPTLLIDIARRLCKLVTEERGGGHARTMSPQERHQPRVGTIGIAASILELCIFV
jgi:hypothetical protein